VMRKNRFFQPLMLATVLAAGFVFVWGVVSWFAYDLAYDVMIAKEDIPGEWYFILHKQIDGNGNFVGNERWSKLCAGYLGTAVVVPAPVVLGSLTGILWAPELLDRGQAATPGEALSQALIEFWPPWKLLS
jgi:hypothetical protein